MLMEAPQRLSRLQMGQELACPTGILGDHSITCPQSLGGPEGQVPEISNRGTNKGQGRIF